MFATQTPAQAYNRVSVDAGSLAASPHKLILMLMEGASVSISTAKHHMAMKQIQEKGAAISRAIDIITNGLQLSLDKGGVDEIGERLDSLYQYMVTRLVHANMHNDAGALNEVHQLLGEIKSAWEEIAGEPAVVSRNTSAMSGL